MKTYKRLKIGVLKLLVNIFIYNVHALYGQHIQNWSSLVLKSWDDGLYGRSSQLFNSEGLHAVLKLDNIKIGTFLTCTNHFFSLMDAVLKRFETSTENDLSIATICLLEASSSGLVEMELRQLLGNSASLMPPSEFDEKGRIHVKLHVHFIYI